MLTSSSKWAAAGLLGLAVCSNVACSDDSTNGNGGGSAGQSAAGTSSGGTAAGGSGGQSPISRPDCLAYCQHYSAACGEPSSICDAYCSLAENVPARCAEQYNSFFECGKTASLDCEESLGLTPADGCGYAELEECVAGAGCVRFDTFDALCEKEHPGLVAFLCTGEDDPGCVVLDPESTSRTRCCPAK